MGEIVGTSTSIIPTRRPPQRKSFYAAGRFWVFYSNGPNMVYKTSTDGVNWAGPTTIRACTTGRRFSIWFDETYMHYTYSLSVLNNPLYYRRGTPNSDGTITWSAAEQTAIAAVADISYDWPTISVDSNGYAWIGYTLFPDNNPYVIMSGNNDGTWGATPGGFPYQLSAVIGNYMVSAVSLTGGEMLAVYIRSNRPVNAQLWNGAVWGAEISNAWNALNEICWSAVAEGNDVHIVYTTAHFSLHYVKYRYSSNSFTGERDLPLGWFPGAPVISIDGNNNLLVFWANYPETNTLYYIKYTAETSTWGPVVKWGTEEEPLDSISLTCFYKQYSGYTGLVYTAPDSSVKFNYIAPPPPPGVDPEPDEPGSPDAPAPTPEPVVVSNTLTSGGSRHTTPKQGSVGTKLSVRRTRITRHITWVPVTVVRA